MPTTFSSLGKLCIRSAYAWLTLSRRGPVNGLIDQYATALETIAYALHILCICSTDICSAADPNFAATYGTQFHRAVSSAYALH